MTAAARRAEVERLTYAVIGDLLPAVPQEAITADKHLRDLGADSVDRVEIILALTDRLAITAPLAGFSDLPTIAALVDRLVELRCR